MVIAMKTVVIVYVQIVTMATTVKTEKYVVILTAMVMVPVTLKTNVHVTLVLVVHTVNLKINVIT